jgi:PAS domain S-box-containing protein
VLFSLGDAVISTDAQGRVELVNPAAEQLTGWSQAESLGRALGEVLRIDADRADGAAQTLVDRVVRERTVVAFGARARLVARDGTQRPVAGSGAPVRGETAEVAGVVLVFRDESDDARQRNQAREAMTSGYNEQEVTQRFAGKGLAGFLQKPFRAASLQAALRRALG